MRVRRNLVTSCVLFAVLTLSACAPTTAPIAESASSAYAYSLTVTFVDAVVYAGATHYYFERADGETLRVIESNDPGELEIDNSSMLIDPEPDEGPPGPNPAFTGRLVTLHYDRQDRVVAVTPAYE